MPPSTVDRPSQVRSITSQRGVGKNLDVWLLLFTGVIYAIAQLRLFQSPLPEHDHHGMRQSH